MFKIVVVTVAVGPESGPLAKISVKRSRLNLTK